MFDAIVAVFVVIAVFSVIASLFTLYAWYTGPQHFAAWRAAMRVTPDHEEVVDGWVDRLHAFSAAMLARVPRVALVAADPVEPEERADTVERRPSVLQWYIDRGAPTRVPKAAAHR